VFSVAKYQSKTLTPKNKNKIFPKFLSPSITKSYSRKAQKNAQNFGSKLHIRLIIEGCFSALS
jgi:glutaredoxin 2